jgi:hypothetical protein
LRILRTSVAKYNLPQSQKLYLLTAWEKEGVLRDLWAIKGAVLLERLLTQTPSICTVQRTLNGVLTNPMGERNTDRDEKKEWLHFSCTRVELQGRCVVNSRL